MVYKSAEDAFPILARNYEIAARAAANVVDAAQAELGVKFASKVTELRSGLDEANLSMWNIFYGIYVTFQADPCGKVDYFAEEMKIARDREFRLRGTTTSLARATALKEAGGGDEAIEKILKLTYYMLDGDHKPRGGSIDVESAEEAVDDWQHPNSDKDDGG